MILNTFVVANLNRVVGKSDSRGQGQTHDSRTLSQRRGSGISFPNPAIYPPFPKTQSPNLTNNSSVLMNLACMMRTALCLVVTIYPLQGVVHGRRRQTNRTRRDPDRRRAHRAGHRAVSDVGAVNGGGE